MIKGVYFDWGGVLIENPSITLMKYLAKYFEKSDFEMRNILDGYSFLFEKYQIGLINESEIWKIIFDKKDISVWQDAVKNCFKIHDEVLEFANELKNKGFKIGVLSNTENEAVNNFDLFFEKSLFEYRVFSCYVNSSKPNGDIYKYAINLIDLKPEEILFIDDREDFIAGAKKYNLKTFLFTNRSQINELKKYVDTINNPV